MKNLVLFIALAMSLSACTAQPTSLANLQTETFTVRGNCGMCKKAIEKSLKVDGVVKADWDQDTKIMTVSYDSTRISLDQIQRNIAAAGYDNDGQRGNDQAYANLPDCCQYDRTTPGSTTTPAEAAPASDSTMKAQINAVLLAYYAVKSALTKDDGKTVATEALQLLATLDEVDVSLMDAGQKSQYESLREKISFDAGHISETNNLKHQRDHFDTLSDNVWLLVKAFDANEQPVYRQFCPMVKKYWVSGDKAIKNPYYGKEMLTCGSVRETLQ